MAKVINEYQLALCDRYGNRLAILDRILGFGVARKVNDIGALDITITDSYLDYVEEDNRVEVWYSVAGGPLQLMMQTVWFIRKWVWQPGRKTINLQCDDTMGLLKRRIVAYAAASAQAMKSNIPADDMLKAILRENYGSLATDAARSWASYLTIPSDLAAAPNLTKSFAWQQVFPVLQSISQACAQNGTFLAFDIEAYGGTTPFQFKTYVGQRGADRRYPTSANPLILSEEMGNLANVEISQDYSQELTYVYCGGGGTEAARTVVEVEKTARIATTLPFGRIEAFRDARNSGTDTDSLTGEANDALRETRPQRVFSGNFIETESCRYGRDINFGDIVTASAGSLYFDCYVNALNFSFTNVDIKLLGVA
jgi:hypothetical protein